MRDFFKADDFIKDFDSYDSKKIMEITNKKLIEYIESCPVVYGEFKHNMIVKPFGVVKGATDNHKARLVCIEEIKKEPMVLWCVFSTDGECWSYESKEKAQEGMRAGERIRKFVEDVI